MAHPSLKGSPTFPLFLTPKTHLAHLGKGREGQVWMVVISSYGDWRLEEGRRLRCIMIICFSQSENIFILHIYKYGSAWISGIIYFGG
jgi:hypothetical protein